MIRLIIFLFLTIMKNILILFAASVFLYSCGTAHPVRISKTTTYKKPSAGTKHANVKVSSDRNNNTQAGNILSDAEKYLGAPYKPGGMTSSGFDCSGFVNTVFAENDIKLTRRSSDQAKEGREVSIREVKHGDLLFFATAGGKRVSHVGIVHTITDDGEIKFIHASTSKGVIISSLDETYWDKAFLFARRVL